VSVSGASAWNSGRTLYVKDTKADGDSAYAPFNNGGSSDSSRGYASGNGNTNSVGLSYTPHFRACVSVPSWPDNCSSWVWG
jgi:hypothetical protein